MRKNFDRLLAGTVLALIVAAPSFVNARPRVEQAMPLPPSLNGHRSIQHREAAPLPPAPPPPEHFTPAEPARAAAPPEPTRAAAPPAPAPAAEPAEATQQAAPAAHEAARGFSIKGALDKLLAASDGQIGDKLRAIVTSRQFDKRIERTPDRKAIQAFYAARSYAPLWIHDGRLTARAKSVTARLTDAGSEGLDPADYPVPDFASFSGAEALADGDIKLTNSVLTFARHMQVGRISPRRVFAQVLYPDHTPEPADILRKISEASDVNAALDSFDPPHQDFRALKAKLAELRANGNSNADAGEAPERIPAGNPIRPGARDTRVPMLRERLHVKGNPANTTYDRALYNAIRSVQYRHGMKPTGIVDSKTIAVINGPKPPTTSQVIATVEANMERWRWLPRDLGDTYVMVNIPDFSLKVVHDHRVVWRTKIVAGKPQTPTPLTTATMDTVIINPSWYVPQSIIQNELLPAYQSDPNIFDRMGLEVKKGPDGNINVVQPPGAANALGRIKFNFANRFQVYLHDTPEKNLFRYDRRAFSHGCMRVQDPTKLGEIILHLAMNGPTPDARQIDALFGHEERDFKLDKRPMVHLTYRTAFIDDSGKLQLRDDLYGFDARIYSIMHSNERRIADIPPPPDPKRDLATAMSNQEVLRRVERREALNPFHFFERLFR